MIRIISVLQVLMKQVSPLFHMPSFYRTGMRVQPIAFSTGKRTPEVVEVQGRHGFQHRELLHQELEDDHDAVHPSHHLEHVPLIPDLVWKEETPSQQWDCEKLQDTL